ncbi:ATP-binding protein [Sphaerisporangium sp. NBC_01403]|uniref:ATP-binding protein n=1 Tax=Sphaerisporangium sp. NBC_01403 TaxID=2903599 RepID=UPI00324A65FD
MPHGRWDLAKRAAAQQLDQMEPAWSVWYGVGTRRFYAVATWASSEPLLVLAPTPEELRDLMRDVERIRAKAGHRGRTPHVSVRNPPDPKVGLDQPHPALTDRLMTYGVSMKERPDGLRTVCWDLPHDLSMVGKTRGLVKDVLTAWALADLADDVVLVVGELLANAINYGDPPIRLSLWGGPGELRVRVTDHGSGQPRHLDLGIESVHGRGLIIVAALAGDHGITPLPDGSGKTVWARWGLPSGHDTGVSTNTSIRRPPFH